MKTKREELAWAAGFFDGEGYIGVTLAKRAITPRIVISIAQVDRSVLDKFQSAVGVGKVYGPYTQRHPKSNPYYQLSIAGFPFVQHTVAQMWTWLSPVKQAQAKAALEKAKPTNPKWMTCEKVGHDVYVNKLSKHVCRTCHAAYMRNRNSN